MRKATIHIGKEKVALLIENNRHDYDIIYEAGYKGAPISLTLPVSDKKYSFDSFPAFFEGLLPEGGQLEALLKQKKIDRTDYFLQLIAVGEDMVGAVTVKEFKS